VPRRLFSALAVHKRVEHALVRRRLRREIPQVADQDEVDARLDELFYELLALTAPGGDLTKADPGVMRACALIEEWTA
jgi:hypothetical protein